MTKTYTTGAQPGPVVKFVDTSIIIYCIQLLRDDIDQLSIDGFD